MSSINGRQTGNLQRNYTRYHKLISLPIFANSKVARSYITREEAWRSYKKDSMVEFNMDG